MLFGLFLTSAAGLLRADATGWIGSDGTKSWQEDGGRKPEEGKFKNRLGQENGPKKTACSNRQDQDISITPLGAHWMCKDESPIKKGFSQKSG
jgi:hypothetical protein